MLARILFISLFYCGIAYCQPDASAQAPSTSAPAMAPTVAPATAPATPASTPPTQGIPGGYNDIEVNDPKVQEAAKFAVQQMQQGSLVKILAAQVQVVAGLNYSLNLELVSQNGVHYQYKVVVYVPLPVTKQPMQLTTVQAMGEISS